MDKAALTKRLRAVFVEELEDHVSTWNDALLRLEQGAPPADLQRPLFRIAHSLKGAARAVSLPTLETYCHGLEEELDALEGAPEGELLGRLFAAADVWAEVARRLRSDYGASPLIVALSGYGSAEDKRRGVEAGFDHHLVKPVRGKELRAELARLWSERG